MPAELIMISFGQIALEVHGRYREKAKKYWRNVKIGECYILTLVHIIKNTGVFI